MDIVERIRTASYTAEEAANEIEWLRGKLETADDEIERLREALRFMLDNDRNLQKPLEELFSEFCNEARKALGETEPEELGEKE